MITDADFGGGDYSRVTLNSLSGTVTYKWYGGGSFWIGKFGNDQATPAFNTVYVPGGGSWGGDFSSTFTSGKYYTFRGKFYPNPSNAGERMNDFVIMETTGAPTEFTGAGSGNPSGTASTGAQTVSVTLNQTPNSEETVYVRYKAGSAAWATVALTSGSGTTRSGSIPAQTAGTVVEYYFLTTTVGKSTLDDNADLCTLNGLKNGANNWSYTATASAPTVGTPTRTGTTATGATLGGTVSATGGATVTSWGVVYSASSLNSDPTVGGMGCTNVTAGSPGTGAFTAAVSGLKANTEYKWKAYAVNSAGTGYTTVQTFTTPCMSAGPVVTPEPGNSSATFRWDDVGAVQYLLSLWTGGASESLSYTFTSDSEGWTLSTAYREQDNSDYGLRIGSGSAGGTAASPVLGFTGNATLTFKAWVYSSDTSCVLYVDQNDGSGWNTLTSTPLSITASSKAAASLTEMSLTGVTASSQIRFRTTTSKKRVRVDDVTITHGNQTYVTGGSGGTAGTVGVEIHDLAVSSPVTVAGLTTTPTPVTYNWSLKAVGGGTGCEEDGTPADGYDNTVTPTAADEAPVWKTIAAITRTLAQGTLTKDMTEELSTAGSPAPKFYVTMNTGSATPTGSYNVNENTGSFTFTPALADAGKTFTFKFEARNTVNGVVQHVYQTMAVTVTGGTLTLTGSFNKFETAAGTASQAQSVTLAGSNLGALETVTVAVGAPFEVSLTGNDNDYASSKTVTASAAGAISSQTVYVRVAASASQGNNQTGTLTASCTSASTSPTKSLTADVSGESTATSIENSYIVVNNGSSDDWYNGSGTGQGENKNFSEKYLGEYTSLKLAAEASTRGDGVAGGHVVTMNYTVDSGTEGAWSTLTMPWKEWDDPLNKHQSHDGAGNLVYTPDLASGRAPGLYYIRVCFSQTTTGGTIWDSRGGLNYVASFRVVPTAPTLAQGTVTAGSVAGTVTRGTGGSSVEVYRFDTLAKANAASGGNYGDGVACSVGAGGTSFSDSTVHGCSTYYYRAWEKVTGNPDGSSSYSAGSNVLTVNTPTPSAPVLNALGNLTHQSFTASWNEVPGAVTYRMDIVQGGGSGTPVLSADFADEGLSTENSYPSGEQTRTFAGQTWLTTAVMTKPEGSSNGAGSAGFLQMQANNGIIVLPTLNGVKTVKVVARGTNALKLQRKVNGAWNTDNPLETWTLSSEGTEYTHTFESVQDGISLRIVGDTANAKYVHDVTVLGEGTTPVAGWTDKDVGSLMTVSGGVVSVEVEGLDELTTYSVTVRAEGATAACKSSDSNTQSATTLENDTVTSVTISDADGDGGATAVAAGAVAAGQTVLVQGTKLAVASGSVNPTLTGVAFTTTGTATGSDIGTLRVRVGTGSTYLGTETPLGTATYTGAGTYTVSGSQTLTADTTYYVWIEAVTEAGAAGGSTVKVSAMTKDAFAITDGRKSGSTSAAGQQTIGNLSSLSAAAVTGRADQGAVMRVSFGRSLDAADSGVLIRWSDVGYSEIPAPGTAWTKETTVAVGTASPVEVSGLTACKTYYFKAWEVVGGAVAGTAKQASGTVSAPAAPTGLGHGTPGAHNASLTWGAAAGATGYVIDLWHYEGGSGGGGSGSSGVAGTYTLVTDDEDLTQGNYVIVGVSGGTYYAMTNATGSTFVKAAALASSVVSGDGNTLTITADDADVVWNLENHTTYWTINNGSSYVIWTESTSKNESNLSEDSSVAKAQWSLSWNSEDSGWEINNHSTAGDRTHLRFNKPSSGDPRFACYSGGQTFARLYKQTGSSGGGGSGGTKVDDVIGGVVQAGSAVTVTPSGATGVNLGGLTDGTTYGWDVKAQGTECTSAASAADSFTTAEVLGVPTVTAWTGLLAGQVTGTVTRASADATVLLKRYESEDDARADVNGHEVATVATETATLVKFTDSGLAGCKTYWYKARQTATVEGDEPTTSGWSALASAETTLAAPDVTPTGAGTSLTLSWPPVAGADYYKVYVATDDRFTEGTSGTGGTTALEENFSTCTGTAAVPESKLSDWDRDVLYCDNGAVRMGTKSEPGWIITPWIDEMANGGVVTFKLKKWSDDSGTVSVMLSTTGEADSWQSLGYDDIEPPADWTEYTVNLPAAMTSEDSFCLLWKTSEKRALLDDVKVTSSGSGGTTGSIIYSATNLVGTTTTASGLTVGAEYWWRVYAVSTNECSSLTTNSTKTLDVPLIQVRPKEWDFGTVDKNASATHDFTVKNTGSQAMSISAISIDPDPGVTAYTITAIGDRTELSTMNDTTGWTLAEGASLTVTVQFKPWRDGERNARLRIRSNAYNANGENTSPAVYGDWDVALTGDCHDPSTEPVSVYRLEVTDGMGVMDTIADHSLALGTADGTGGELPGAVQPTLSVLAWQYNGLDTASARWSLVDPNGTTVYADRTFDSVSTVQHGGKACTNFTARIPPVGAEGAVRGAYTVLFTVNDLSGDHGVVDADKFTPPEKGWLVEDFTRSDREATGSGALENGWIVTATDGEAGEAAIHADQLELYGPNGEMSGDPGRISVVRDMGDEEYEKHFEDMVSTVSWGFHFRTGAKTASLADGSTAGAFVLGATSDDWFGTSAAGYAVLMANDTVSLASFSGGLRNPSLAGCTVTTLTPADPSKPSAYTNGVAGKWLAVRVDFAPGQEYIADVQEAVSPKLKLYVAVAEGPGGNPLEECEEEHLVCTVPIAEFLSDNLQYAGMVWNHGYAQLSDKTGCAFDDLYFPHQKGQREPMRVHVIDEDTDAPVIDGLDLPTAVAVDKLLSGGGGLTVTGMVHDASGVWTSGSGTAPQAELRVDGTVAWSGAVTLTPAVSGADTNVSLSVTIPAGAAAGLSSSTVTTNCALVLTVHDRDRDRAGDSLAAVSTNWFTLCDSEPAAPAWATVEGDGAEMAVLRWGRTAGTTYVVVRSDTEFGPRATPTQGTKAEPFEGTEYAGLGTVVYYGTGDNHLAGAWTAREFVVAPGSANYFAVYGMTGNGTTGYFFSEPTMPTDWSWTASDGVKYATADQTAGGMPSTPATAVRSNSWPLVTATYEPGEGVDAFAYRTSVTSPDDTDPAGKSVLFGYGPDSPRPETGSGWGGPWAGDTDKWMIHDGSLLTGDTHYPAATANKLYWQDTSWSEENEGEEWRYATSATLTRPLSGTASGDFFVAAVIHFQFHGRGKYASIALMNGNTELVSFGKQGDGQGNGDDDWSRCAAMWLNSTYRKAGTGTATVKATGGATPYDMGTDDGQDHVIVGQVSPGSKKVRLWAYGPSRSGVRIAELFTSAEAGVPTAMGQLLAELDMSDAAWPGVTAIRLQAGSDASGALGHVYFDEVRFAGTWEELFLFNAPEVYKFEFDQPEPGTGIMVGMDDEGHRQWKISDGALAHGNVGLNAQFQLFHRTGISSASFTIKDAEGNQILKEQQNDAGKTAPESGGTLASVALSGTTGSAVSDWTTTSASGVPGGALGVAVPTNMISTNATYTVEVTLTSAGGKEATVTSASESGGGGATDLFFGEYGEGSYWDKYIELYNGTGKDIDLYNYYLFRPKKDQDWGDYSSLIPNDSDPFARLASSAGTTILHHKETIVLLNYVNQSQTGGYTIKLTNEVSGEVTTINQSFTAADRLNALKAGLDATGARYLVMPNAVLDSGGEVPYLLIAASNFNESVVTAAKGTSAVDLNWLDACGLASLVFTERKSERYIMSRRETAPHLPRSAPLTIDPEEWGYRDWGYPKSNWRYDDFNADLDDTATLDPDRDKYTNFVATAGAYDSNIGLGGNMEFTVFDDDEVAPVLAASGHGIDLGSGVTAPVAGTQDLLVAGWSFTNVEESATAADVAAPWDGSIEVSSARLTCSDNLGSVERLVEKGAGKGVAGVSFNGTAQAQNGDLYFACNDAEYNITAEDDVWIGFETDMENMTERKVSFWYASGSGGFKAGHVEVSADGGTWVNPEGWTLAFDEAEGTGGAETFVLFEKSLEFTKSDGTTLAIPRETEHLRFRVHLSERKAGTGTFRMDGIQVHGKPLEVVVTDAELLGTQPAFQATMSDAGSGLDVSSASFGCGVSGIGATPTATLVDGGKSPSALKWQAESALDKAGVQAWYEASEAEALHLRVEVKDADDDRPGDQLDMRGHFGVLRVVDDDPLAPVMASEGNGIDIDGTLAEPEEGSSDLVVAGWSFTNTTGTAEAMAVWSGSAMTDNAALTCCGQLGTVEGLVVIGNGKGVSNVEFNGTKQEQKGELYFTCANAGDEPDVWVGFEMDMMAMTEREVSFWYAGGSGGFGSGWVELSTDNGVTWRKPERWDLSLPTGGASKFAEFAQSLEWEENGEPAVPRNIGHLMFRVHVAKGVSSTGTGTFRMDCMQVHGKPSEVTVTDHDLVGKAPSFKAKVSDPGSGLDTSRLSFSYGNLGAVSAVTADTSKLVDGGKGAASELSWQVSSALSTDDVHQWFTNAAAGDTLLKLSVQDADDDRTDDQLQLNGPIGVLQVVDDDSEPPEIVMKSLKPRTGGVLGEWFFDSKEKANQGVASLRANGLHASELRARTGDLEPTLPHSEGSVYDGAGAGTPPGYGAWQMGWHGGNKYWYVRLETLVGTTGADGATFTVTDISFNSKVNQMKGPTACDVKLVQGVTSIDAHDKALDGTTTSLATGLSLLPSGSAWTADTVKTWKSVSIHLSNPIVLAAHSVNELQLWATGADPSGSLARWYIHDLKISGTVQYANGQSEEVTYVTDHALATGASVGNLTGSIWDESGLSEATYTMSGWAEPRALTFTAGSGTQAERMAAATTEGAGAFSVEMSEIPVTYTGLTLQDYRGTVEAWDGDADRTSGNGTVNEDRLKIEGEFGFTVIDQDVVEPTAPSGIAGNGVTLGEAPTYGTAAWNNAPWTNNPEFIVTFTPAEDTAPTADQLSGDDYAAWRTEHGLEQVDAGQAAHQLVATGIGEYRVAASTDAASLADAPAFSVAAVQGALGNYGFERYASLAPWSCVASGCGINKQKTDNVYPASEGTNSFYIQNYNTYPNAVLTQTIAWTNTDTSAAVEVSGSVDVFKVGGNAAVWVLIEVSETEDFAEVASAEIQLTTSTTSTYPIKTWMTRSFSATLPASDETNETLLRIGKNASFLRITFRCQAATAYLDNARLSVTKGTVGPAMRYEAEQGLATKHLFAVDADNDRLGDRRTGGSVAFYTAYDGTPPTPVAFIGGANHGAGASTDHVDDPTTQFDLTWTTSNVGPDDTESDEYAAMPAANKRGVNSLSPWGTFRVYYRTYDPVALEAAATDAAASSTAEYLYKTLVRGPSDGWGGSGEETAFYKDASLGWKHVENGDEIEDVTAPEVGGKRQYSGWNVIGAGSQQTVRLYDLDFDQEYLVVVVGVDKAGNEGSVTATSWATNNTIKFSLTRGWHVPKADAVTALEGRVSDIGQRLTNTVVSALEWTAAGMTRNAETGEMEGEATKDYDLLQWDARNFRESPDNDWKLLQTVKTNWFVDDGGPTNRGAIRFYRASYKDRWQKAVTNATTGQVTAQTPLVSEEVYAQTAVPLRPGQNFTALHGVPYTNTLRGVFGGLDEFPGDNGESSRTWITFYPPGETEIGHDAEGHDQNVYYLNGNGIWRKQGDTATDWSDRPLDANLFTRAFSIDLPNTIPGKYVAGTNYIRHGSGAHAQTEEIPYMLWKPILQVPTNGFERVIECGNQNQKTYNTVALQLPVAVHPSQMNLRWAITNADTTVTWYGMRNGEPWEADEIFTIDPITREPGHSCYCDPSGNWKFVSGENVPWGYFKPNDILVIVSKNGGVGNTWTWTYDPAKFYPLPNRHMQAE